MPSDPEIEAIRKIVEVLDGLDHGVKRRVLTYVSNRLDADLTFEPVDFMKAVGDGMQAINTAAQRLTAERGETVTGIHLVNVVARMYDEANTPSAEADSDA